jgi:histidinol-phosphate phosphatase family protein
MIRAAFIDKDGTLIDNVPHNVDPELVALAPGAVAALELLTSHGFHPIVVSNQPGIADGRFPQSALAAVERRIRELLAPSRATIDAFYYCPHSADGACRCRKPAPGLLLDAAADRDIDLARSWMLGDILDDVEAGRRAGCRAALVVNGNETVWRLGPFRTPDVVARSLDAAARWIVDAEHKPHARLRSRPQENALAPRVARRR